MIAIIITVKIMFPMNAKNPEDMMECAEIAIGDICR
jgi:hypothetical protein